MITLFLLTYSASFAALYVLTIRYKRDKLVVPTAFIVSVFGAIMAYGESNDVTYGAVTAVVTPLLAILYVKARGNVEKSLWTNQVAVRMQDMRDTLDNLNAAQTELREQLQRNSRLLKSFPRD